MGPSSSRVSPSQSDLFLQFYAFNELAQYLHPHTPHHKVHWTFGIIGPLVNFPPVRFYFILFFALNIFYENRLVFFKIWSLGYVSISPSQQYASLESKPRLYFFSVRSLYKYLIHIQYFPNGVLNCPQSLFSPCSNPSLQTHLSKLTVMFPSSLNTCSVAPLLNSMRKVNQTEFFIVIYFTLFILQTRSRGFTGPAGTCSTGTGRAGPHCLPLGLLGPTFRSLTNNGFPGVFLTSYLLEPE